MTREQKLNALFDSFELNSDALDLLTEIECELLIGGSGGFIANGPFQGLTAPGPFFEPPGPPF